MSLKKKTASARQVERERLGIDYDPVSPFCLESISDQIEAVMNKAGLKDKLWQQGLIDDWPEIVGEDVSRHTRPGRLDRGKLTIYVDSSTWLHVLERDLKDVLQKRIENKIGSKHVNRLLLLLDPAG